MVATPIGNLRDITLCALDVLASVDLVAAEDTRHTLHLLSAHGITAKLLAAHEHNELAAAEKLVTHLRAGGSAALVTDAGTPAISDPGARVVRVVREAGIPVVPIPGPSAAVTALSAAGIHGAGFEFAGFLPTRREARRRAIESFRQTGHAVLFYEAPHRIREAAEDLREVLGDDRRLVICRELTKRFEEIHECALADVAAWLDADANRERGEFVVVLPPAEVAEAPVPDQEAQRILGILARALPPSRAARVAAEITGLRKDDFYAAATRLSSGGPVQDTQDENP